MLVHSPALTENEVNIVRWCASGNWASDPKNLASDDLCRHSGLFITKLRDTVSRKLLVLRLAELVPSIKVNPQLEANCSFFETSWHLCMHDPSASCHPLNISRPNRACMALKVFMQHFAGEHICDCFEASVGVVRESGWQLYIEQVEHEEGIHPG